MNEVNRTLYIPLYGKAAVSRRGIILRDATAESIWKQEGFALHGKAKSRWLAYYMAMRARVFDNWTQAQLAHNPAAVVLHIGCGMDSRVQRIGAHENTWYDIDFPAVIQQRAQYFAPSEQYHMLGADVSDPAWLDRIPSDQTAVVVLEGVSMYLTEPARNALLAALVQKFCRVHILMDCYTVFAAKASRYMNPVKSVGAEIVSGVDDPAEPERVKGVHFIREWDMTPPELSAQLTGWERRFFRLMFGGRAAKNMYRLFEYDLYR